MALVAGCVDAAPDDARPDVTQVTIDGRDLRDVVSRAPDAPPAVDGCALARAGISVTVGVCLPPS